MHHSKLMLLILVLATFCSTATAASAQGNNPGSRNPGTDEALWGKGAAGAASKKMQNQENGGDREFNEKQEVKKVQTFPKDMAAKGVTKAGPMNPIPNPEWEKGFEKQVVEDMPFTNNEEAGAEPTATTGEIAAVEEAKMETAVLTDPQNWTKPAQAAAQAQATQAGNAAGEVSRDQASSAIDFCAHYLNNFTTDGGNKWNVLRNNIFVPMGILLLLPGALLTQLRAIMAAGNPILGNVNPLEGIMRSVIAIFLIPATYLVVNYSIDLSNSITFTINSEYFRLFGSDMYKDAICAEIRAFPVRGEQENRNASDLPIPSMTPMVNPSGLFAKFEGMMENKIEDPCSGIFKAPGNRADEAMTSGSIAARLGLNGSNAALTASWNILCAFQMAYLYYLWFIGPIAAGLWVWPMKQLRGALPSWVEGVITLAFWSLFWNTAILLIACFKGVGETGCVLITALHFLATASVKHAFDFAGLVRAAGQEAASMAEKAMKSGGAGGGGGGGGGGGCGASKGGSSQGQGAPNTADGIGATSSNVASHAGVSGAAVSPMSIASSNSKDDSSTGTERVRSGGLGEVLSPRTDSKGDGVALASHTGSPFGDKALGKDTEALPPSADKIGDVDLSTESQYAAMFCSAEFAGSDIDALAVDDISQEFEVADATDSSTSSGDINNLTASDRFNSTADGTAADASGLPPSAAAFAEQQAKKDEMRELVAAHAGDKAKEAEAQRQAKAEHLAESINNHLHNLGASVAGANHVGAGAHSAGASVLNATGLTNFDVNNALTSVAASNSANSTNVSNGWVSNDSYSADFAKFEAGDILGSVDSIDASVDNSLSAVATSANFDSSVVTNPAFAAPAVGNLNQYGDVTNYGGSVVPSGAVDRSALVATNDTANAYTANAYTANAYTATDAYGAPIVTNALGVPAMTGNQIDASSNPVYSAQAMSGNPVVAAVENYNNIPTGVHATVAANEVYAAPAMSGNYVASAQSTNSYAADYSTQSTPVSSSNYSVDYSQSTPVASNSNYSVDYSQSTPINSGAQQQSTPVFASVLPSSTPVDYTAPAQPIAGTQSAGNVEYYSAQAAPAASMVASSSQYVDNSSSNSAPAQYASYSAPAQPQYASNSAPAQYDSNSAPTQYAPNSALTQYASNLTQAQYDSNSASTQYASNSTQAQYDSNSATTQYASNSAPTQYAPQQGQPSSFIQPSAPANEYYAAPSQSAPLIAALITPNQSAPIEVAAVQSQQQSYSNPVQYYLANSNTQAETRSVENIAPIERTAQQSSDVVYSRSNSEAYTTVTPYRHVENTESRPVSFAPASSQNVQHGPQAVTQYEAVLSQQQIHSKVQQAQGLITRMNTILSGSDAPHAVNNSNDVKTASIALPAIQNQEPSNQTVTKKSLSDLLPVQRRAKAAPKDEFVVAPPPMSSSWFET
ncbi:hypothetical protein BH10CYA1_BH10CYA1_05030 [soil metagenome]